MKDKDLCSNSRRQARKRARLGRPPGDPRKARSERLVTFVTRDQMQLMKTIGEEKKKSLSAVCYEFLTDALTREGTDKTERRLESRTASSAVVRTQMEKP